jgi:hypothetical protein
MSDQLIPAPKRGEVLPPISSGPEHFNCRCIPYSTIEGGPPRLAAGTEAAPHTPNFEDPWRSS